MSTSLSPDTQLPIPEGLPIPNRKIIRGFIEPFAVKSTARAILLLLLDIGIWFALIAGVVLIENLFIKIILGNIAGFWIGRLFILGHDACHQSFTPHRELNKVLGRIAFLPSLTPFSLWEVGHNVVHHGQTNLKGFDFVWAPASLEEFNAMPAWRKSLERLYRSGWGPVFYYIIETGGIMTQIDDVWARVHASRTPADAGRRWSATVRIRRVDAGCNVLL
jgi:omega-6 fatty acid desaturase (delta-12 desaturase)